MRSIQSVYPHTVFFESENGASSLLLLNKEKIDLAIIDENLPIISGVDVIERYIQANSLNAKFILLSEKHNYINYQKSVKLGVQVFVDKDQIDQDILTGIKAIKTGKKYICDCLIEEINTIEMFATKVANLSAKERIFLTELKKGKSIQEISDKLVISNKSVNQITSNISEKLDLPSNKTFLARWALTHKHYIK